MIPSNGCNSTFCLDTLDRRGDLEQPNLLDLSFPGNASNLTMNLFSSNSAIAMKGFFKSTPPQDIQIVDALPHKMLEDVSCISFSIKHSFLYSLFLLSSVRST